MILKLVETHAQKNPDSIALVYGKDKLTYAELISKVYTLADILRNDYNVKENVFVPLNLYRSFDTPIALLAVMAAKGICLPIDPKQPADRIKFMLHDCNADFVVSNLDMNPEVILGRKLLDLRDCFTGRSSLNLDDAHQSKKEDDRTVYCIYTSGSTGKPKGVLLGESGIYNVLSWAQESFIFTEKDSFLQKASFTFDISILELFLPLITGGRLVLPLPSAERSPKELLATIKEEQVTFVQFTPSGLATYLADQDYDPLPGVTACLCAGEPLKSSLRDEFYKKTSAPILYNLYGPTEATIYATAGRVPKTGLVTVGAPLPGIWIEMLDDQMSSIPHGEVGELWIGGRGVAQSYLNRNDLTKERFKDQAGDKKGPCYRSGDLGRYLPSAEIDVRGRIDYQVKIRGYRIELGEIESALSTLDGVNDAVVVSIEFNGTLSLVAYWIGVGESDSLMIDLLKSLPQYMVPARFIKLDSFPLTSSGKVDRSKLPSPEQFSARTTEVIAPTDFIESSLCEIYAEILGWDQVGTNDRFLNLGGDSLKAVRVIFQIQQKLSLHIPIEKLLKNDTIAEVSTSLIKADSTKTVIESAPTADWYPLSSGQLGLWILEQAGSPHAAFVEPLCYEITGQLDQVALRQAVESLLNQHESLSTAIHKFNGVPLQKPVPPRLDWREEIIDDTDEVKKYISHFVELDFDLVAGQLFRALLIQSNPNQHYFILTMHHIATDGWSMTLVAKQIFATYNSLINGLPPQEAPELQYKDYSYWQQAQTWKASKNYWMEKLSGNIETLSLPTESPRPNHPTFKGKTLSKILSSQYLDAFKDLCQRQNVTLYAGLSAILRVLFHRHTGQKDFSIGTTTHGRQVPELADQIGFYTNMIVLRDQITESTKFSELLRTSAVTLLEAIEHGEYPFANLVNDLNITENLGSSPLANVMIQYDPGWANVSEEPDGLKLRYFDAPNARSKMDLTIFFRETSSGLNMVAEYSTDIFNEDYISRMLEQFGVLLQSSTSTPDAEIGRLPMLPETEKNLVLGNSSNIRDYDLSTPIHQLFEKQVLRVPERIATVDMHRKLTYAELNAQANSFAMELRKNHEVGPNVIVALLLERSVEMMIAILGILKAGGTYLPLNRKDPQERLLKMLNDSEAVATVINSDWAIEILEPNKNIIDLRDPIEENFENIESKFSDKDGIYCIFTSGSTGDPNGVLVEHRSVVNRFEWTVEELGITENDVFLQKTPYSFDVSVWELLLPFTLGAKQVFLCPDGESNPIDIQSAIDKHTVTIVHFVPTMLDQYLTATENGFKSVRHCICSGEALERNLANRFLAMAGGSQLHNYYGPTEATIDVSRCRVITDESPINIGRPAPNNRFYILSSTGEPCPIGVIGDLWIAGLQLARGYLKRPELNAERFSADPFVPGDRMYRSGDLAKWLPTGEVLYVGRSDGQIKLRGFRIELSEIEHALTKCDGVTGAVVLMQKSESSGDSLIASITGPDAPSPQQLRKKLLELLPEYMIPSLFNYLESFPKTKNGKVNRKILSQYAGLIASTDQTVTPRNQIESEILTIWNRFLPIPATGVVDDFLTVGGSSLRALQVGSAITKKYTVAVGLADIFKYRTVAEQAQLVEEKINSKLLTGIVISAHARTERHILSPAQERMWFIQTMEPSSSSSNIRFFANLSGPLDCDIFRDSVEELVARHEILRSVYVNINGRPFQVPGTDLPLPFEHRGLSSDVEAGLIYQLAEEQVQRPFNLELEQPIRVFLYSTSYNQHYVLIVLHHIAGDAWSMKLLLQELSMLYSSKVKGEVSALEPLPLQYIDYAESITDPIYEPLILSDLDYWKKKLQDSTVLDLPTDAPTVISNPNYSFKLAPESTKKLEKLAKNTSSTMFEITMTALNLLLSRLSDQLDITVGFPVVNRQDQELEKVMGLFLNTLLVRTDLRGDPTFAELLKIVSTNCREAYDHQLVPFERLVEEINPPRQLDRTPLFDVLLNYTGDLQETLSIEGVGVEIVTHQLKDTPKFALTIYVSKVNDGLQFEMVYRSDLFSSARIESMASQLKSILQQVIESPNKACSSISLLEQKQHDQLNAMLSIPIETKEFRPVVESILEWSSNTKEQIAIEQGNDSLTYGKLGERVELLAQQLIKLGCKTGEVTALIGSRGIGFVVGMLAVLRSGSVVFPLDSNLPEKRREQLLTIGKPTRAILIEQMGIEWDISDLGDIPITRINARTGISTKLPGATVELPTVASSAPAYLFFTSGTTGTPRGVLGWHGALAHFLDWQSKTFTIPTTCRCAQTTNVSFDVMLRDTLLALVSGGTLIIPEPEDEWGGAALFEWISRKKISILHMAPTVLKNWLMDVPDNLQLEYFKLLFMAGEPLPTSLVKEFRNRFPKTEKIINLYGPTETTMAKFFYEVPQTLTHGVIPVGFPLPQCQGLVMRGDNFCSVGEIGEIIIHTPYRTLGYVNDKIAAKSFVSNLRSKDEDDLLYRTGDFGRLLPDGKLEVLGRLDHQVKINGVRIQPLEVESILSGHPSITSCCITPFKGKDDGEIRLLAYVVTSNYDEQFSNQLRAYMRERLPQAMVPREFIKIEKLPMTVNGKVDLKALPRPVESYERNIDNCEIPASKAEKEIAAIWIEILNCHMPGINEDFFQLGGTSMKLLRLFYQLNIRYPDTFRIAQLFVETSISAQAKLVKKGSNEPQYEEVEVHEI